MRVTRGNDSARLRHMLEAAQQARQFVEGHTRQSIEDDLRTQFALARALEIIGEAAKNITHECQSQHQQIAWQDVKGIRNRLAHAYFKVDLDVVWETVVDHLPPLIAELERILAEADA